MQNSRHRQCQSPTPSAGPVQILVMKVKFLFLGLAFYLICSSSGHEGYPKFDVDMESHMLGSVKPYRRQVITYFVFACLLFSSRVQLVISTGKIDWDREVTDTKGSLAAFLAQVEHRKVHASHPRRPSVTAISLSPPDDSILLQEKVCSIVSPHNPLPPSSPPPAHNTSGVFNATDSKRISILNGSHNTLCHDPDYETILVFPDYKLVTEVPRSVEGAQNLWDTCVDPELGRAGGVLEKSPFNSWVIPYACVILLCEAFFFCSRFTSSLLTYSVKN